MYRATLPNVCTYLISAILDLKGLMRGTNSKNEKNDQNPISLRLLRDEMWLKIRDLKSHAGLILRGVVRQTN